MPGVSRHPVRCSVNRLLCKGGTLIEFDCGVLKEKGLRRAHETLVARRETVECQAATAIRSSGALNFSSRVSGIDAGPRVRASPPARLHHGKCATKFERGAFEAKPRCDSVCQKHGNSARLCPPAVTVSTNPQSSLCSRSPRDGGEDFPFRVSITSCI